MRRTQNPFSDLPENCNLELVMMKHQANPNWGTLNKLPSLYSFSVKVKKIKEKLKCYRWKETDKQHKILDVNTVVVKNFMVENGKAWMVSEE